MTEQIKACPFCGSTKTFVSYPVDNDTGDYWVVCPNCWTRGPESRSQDEAVEFWNRRALVFRKCSCGGLAQAIEIGHVDGWNEFHEPSGYLFRVRES